MVSWLTQENFDAYRMSMTEKRYDQYVRALEATSFASDALYHFLAYNQPILSTTELRTDVSLMEAYTALYEYKFERDSRNLLILGAWYIMNLTSRGIVVDLNAFINVSDDGFTINALNVPKPRDGVLHIPEKTVVIESGSWAGDENITRVIFGDMTTVINNDAFNGCTNLQGITFNKRITFIDSAAFYGTSVESLNLPGSLRRIGDTVFADCTHLSDVIFNDGLRAIGDDAFRGACCLRRISLPLSVKYLGDRAFSLNTILEEVSIEGVEHIGSHCFAACRGLTQLHLGANVQSLGKAFAEDCDSLKHLYIPGRIVDVHEDAFVGLPKDCTVHVMAKDNDASIVMYLYDKGVKYEVV